MGGSPGFFDLDERYAALSASGDPLERLSAVVDFEIFRPLSNQALCRSDGSKGGRPPVDPVMMFKIMILQALYGLSDEQAEFQIIDRQQTIDPFPAGTAARRLRRATGCRSCAF
jgi:transposase, IS5 family